jgi:hypothetical protein
MEKLFVYPAQTIMSETKDSLVAAIQHPDSGQDPIEKFPWDRLDSLDLIPTYLGNDANEALRAPRYFIRAVFNDYYIRESKFRLVMIPNATYEVETVAGPQAEFAKIDETASSVLNQIIFSALVEATPTVRDILGFY